MTCHYLCKAKFECTLTKGGVFIPLQSHFDQFCLTDNFMMCGHYRKLANSGSVDAPSSGGVQLQARGRRQHIRKSQSFSVELCPCDPSGVMASASDEMARILDYSQGGVRIKATQSIAQSEMLNFRFGNDFIVPQLHGVAVVRWQKPCEEDGQWEAGLAFEGHLVKALIAVQMSM